MYKKLPSELLCIEDEYTAYCFDEACAVIISKVNEGLKPNFCQNRKGEKEVRKHYTSFATMYEDILTNRKDGE